MNSDKSTNSSPGESKSVSSESTETDRTASSNSSDDSRDPSESSESDDRKSTKKDSTSEDTEEYVTNDEEDTEEYVIKDSEDGPFPTDSEDQDQKQPHKEAHFLPNQQTIIDNADSSRFSGQSINELAFEWADSFANRQYL